MADSCEHIDAIDAVKPAAAYECEECVKIGGRWVQLYCFPDDVFAEY